MSLVDAARASLNYKLLISQLVLLTYTATQQQQQQERERDKQALLSLDY